MLRPALLMPLALLLSGCGSWAYVSVPYQYQEPPVLPLEGLGTYAVVIEGQRGAKIEDKLTIGGLERVSDPAQADVVVKLTLSEPKDQATEVVRVQRYTSTGKPLFREARFAAKWPYTVGLHYSIVDASRGDRVVFEDETTYTGVFRRDGAVFKEEKGAESWALTLRGSVEATDAQLAQAAEAALKLLHEKAADLARPHSRRVRLRLAQEAPDDERVAAAYRAVRKASRPADGPGLVTLYERLELAPPAEGEEEPADAEQRRHAARCGRAAGQFVGEDYHAARKAAEEAIELQRSGTLTEFLQHCDVMIERTELPKPKPKRQPKR